MKQAGEVEVTEIKSTWLATQGVRLEMLREDLLDPGIPGNKLRKLTYNLKAFQAGEYEELVTFGGAHSNHIAAVAEAGTRLGINTVGIIRGNDDQPLSPTLALAQKKGMRLLFVSREAYRNRSQTYWASEFGAVLRRPYFLPEGGSNAAAVKGSSEMLGTHTAQADVICCPVGTGGTLAGLVVGKMDHQQVVGFSALKGGEQLSDTVRELLSQYEEVYSVVTAADFELRTQYHFGGYAKITEELVLFTRRFYADHAVPLDLIYTAKMMWGIYREIEQGQWAGKRILAVHTGGLQGNEGMMKRYGLAPWY